MTVAYFLYSLVKYLQCCLIQYRAFFVFAELCILLFTRQVAGIWGDNGRGVFLYFFQFVFAVLRSLQFTEDWTVAVALKSATSDGATD